MVEKCVVKETLFKHGICSGLESSKWHNKFVKFPAFCIFEIFLS